MTDEREPSQLPYALDSEADLETGADDGPDILVGAAEREPDLSTITLHETPFRTPHSGERLSEAELERDIE